MECFGCRLANKSLPVYVIYEDPYVCCFLDHNPFNEGHILILPKNHYRYFDELDEKTAFFIMKAIKICSKVVKKLYKPDGISVIQNGGTFDDLTHLHIHIVPRYKGQDFADFYIEDDKELNVEEWKLLETQKQLVAAIDDLLVFDDNILK